MSAVRAPANVAMEDASERAYQVNERKNRERSNELADLTRKVEALFAEVVSRLHNPPSKDGCGTFAGYLMAVRSRKKAEPVRQANIQAALFSEDITKPLKDARAAGRALWRSLQPLRGNLADRVSENEALLLSSFPPALVLLYKERLELLEAAAKAVEALLPALDEPPIAPWTDRDEIRFIAEKAQEAWAETNDGKAPTGKHEDDPLVKLVAGALWLVGAGVGRSPEAVSFVLLDKRRTKKGGTKTKLKMSPRPD